MRWLIDDPDAARRLGEQARRDAVQRFGIDRFVADWCAVLDRVVVAAA
jgi:hypothetical protein